MGLRLVEKYEVDDRGYLKEMGVNRSFISIAGPCSVESYEQVQEIAKGLKDLGVDILRGGTYKPRMSPYSFQGLEIEGLKILHDVGKKNNLLTLTEVMDTRDVEVVAQYADFIQIGARNMYNYSLLKEVGRGSKPVILKRGLSSTIEEWLYSAEYILKEGNKKVILCERGIRTFETWTRNTLDLSAVALIKSLTKLPIIVDPSHAAGKRELVEPMCLAAVMAMCDGLMIEVHEHPELALSDGNQSITVNEFKTINNKVSELIKVKGKIDNEESIK